MTIDIQLNISIRTHIDKHARLILDIRASLTESPPVDSTHVWWRIELFFGTIRETLIDWKYENSLSQCSYSVFLFQVFFKSISTSKYNVSTLPETNLSHLKTVRNHPQKGKTTSSSSHQVIIPSSHQVIITKAAIFPKGFWTLILFVSGAAGNQPPTPHPGSWWWVGCCQITSRKAQASQPYWSGWQGFQSSHGMRSCVPSDGQMDGWESQTSWDKHVNL